MTTRPSPGDAPREVRVITSLTFGSPWGRRLPNKVPEVSATFWILTILASTAGPPTAGFLSTDLGTGLGTGPGTGLAMGVGMSATTAIVSLVVGGVLLWQLSTGHCFTGLYWFAVVLVSVLGTLVSDDLVDHLGVSLWVVTVVLGALLAVALTGWRRSGHTPSVHTVLTRERETWYWCAVFCAFSLGTTIGDLVSAKLELGHVASALVLGALLTMIVLAHHGFRLDAVAFWAAYVVVRPFGGSIEGLIAEAPRDGGLGLGARTTSATLLGLLVLVGLSTVGAHRLARHEHDAAA